MEYISNLKENLNSTVDMLELSPVKSVGTRNKIGYGKRKLTEICDVAKGETWKSIECRQWQKCLNYHKYFCTFS